MKNGMMFGGDTLVKDIFCNCTFTYFKVINKIVIPLKEDKFYSFLYLCWPNVENENYLDFLISHELEEWSI